MPLIRPIFLPSLLLRFSCEKERPDWHFLDSIDGALFAPMLKCRSNGERACRGCIVVALLVIAMTASTTPVEGAEFDVIIRNGTIYDGSGGQPVRAAVGIIKDRITANGPLGNKQAIV